MKRKIKVINLPLLISCFDWVERIELTRFHVEDGDSFVWVEPLVFNSFDEEKYNSERIKSIE